VKWHSMMLMPDASTTFVSLNLHSLRVDLPFFALAAVFVVAGLATIVLWWLRSREPLLLWLGILTILYGTRLAVANPLLQLDAGLSIRTFTLINAVITSCILISFALFFRELFGAPWRRITNAWLWLQIILAPIGILVAFTDHWDVFWAVNNAVADMGSMFVVLMILTRRVSSTPVVLRVSLLIFLTLVIVTNFTFTGEASLEPLGFAVLIAGLGYTAAGRAVERERKLLAVENELGTARRIQTSILPRSLPVVPGLTITARYEPMTEVAGDFYDFLPADGGLTILVADVSGHGVPAAMIASMLKLAFEAQAENARDPAKILTGLNAVLARPLDGRFVTAACAFIDCENGLVTYAGAGHPPVLLLRAAGEVLELAENGLMLGPFAAAKYESVRVPFARGDRLLLYTDGIIEATLKDGEEFGLHRLKEFARANRISLADRLIAAVSGPLREDDLTVVVAEACSI
jgi:sigma-B regulation protein RsbU (phosphoserine phosphatase)